MGGGGGGGGGGGALRVCRIDGVQEESDAGVESFGRRCVELLACMFPYYCDPTTVRELLACTFPGCVYMLHSFHSHLFTTVILLQYVSCWHSYTLDVCARFIPTPFSSPLLRSYWST